MALAILEYPEIEGGAYKFKADIGTNLFYRYIIGKTMESKWGNEWIINITHTSRLMQHDSPSFFQKGFEFKVPAELFDGESQFIQLQSFKDQDRRSPAISRPVRLRLPKYDKLKTKRDMNSFNPITFNPYKTESLSYKELPVSHTLFIDKLLEITKIAAPILKDIVPGIIGAIKPKDEPDKKTDQKEEKKDSKIDEKQLIETIIQVLTKLGATNTPQTSQSKSFSRSSFVPDGKTSRAMDGGVISGPALMAMLGPLIEKAMPAIQTVLGPLAEKAPEILKVFYDKPIEFLNAINEAELKDKKESQKFMLDMLKESNKFALAEELSNIDFRNNENLSLQEKGKTLPLQSKYSATKDTPSTKAGIVFQFNQKIIIQNKERVAFFKEQGIKLTMKMTFTGKAPSMPLPKAKLNIAFKNATNKKTYAEKEFRLTNLDPVQAFSADFSNEELLRVPLQEDILVVAELKWPKNQNSTGIIKGISTIYFVPETFLINKTSESKAELDLEDRNQFRSFWNKIWASPTGTDDRWKLEMKVKYNTLLDTRSESNVFDKTKIALDKEDSDDNESYGKMKSAIKFSIYELNKLLPYWDGQYMLDSNQIELFKGSEAKNLFTLEAMTRLELRGRKDEIGEIWAVPVFKLYKFNTGRALTDSNGAVTDVSMEDLWFPVPEHIRFIGLKSK